VKLGVARSFSVILALACAVSAQAQNPPPECAGLLPNNVIDITVRPALFIDSETTPGGHDSWVLRGQFVPFTSFEINLGPEADQQQATLMFTRTADDVVVYSETLGPTDFETFGAANNNWRHSVRESEALPGDTWRYARFKTSRASATPGFLNRLKITFKGVFETPLAVTDQDGVIPMRVTLRIEPNGGTTCAEDPSLCLCATYPLTCKAPGGNGTIRCFSAPTT
jgi:hypothetical protein